jgi:hypothetical protein
MNKRTLLALSIALSTLAGCAVPAGEGDEAPSAADEAAQKKGPKTRADRIEECKQGCYGNCVPCGGGGGLGGNPFAHEGTLDKLADRPELSTKASCNPAMSPDLGPNPFCIAQCDDDCAKTQ